MYCPKCGKAADENAVFCENCGYSTVKIVLNEGNASPAPLKAAIKKKLPPSTFWTGIVALLVICALVAVIVFRAPGSPVPAAADPAGLEISAPVDTKAASATDEETSSKESQGFATPEDAIRHFYEALAANDFDKAIEACAVREQAESFDFPGSVERLKMHMPFVNMAPSTCEMFRDLNNTATAGAFAGQIKIMVYSFFVTEGLDGKPVMADRNYAENFAKAVDPQKLHDLKLLRVDPPVKSLLESTKNVENFTKAAKIYGAEEQTERIVLYELNGETYAGGFGLYRYASGWKICRLNSNLAGQPSYGTVTKMTEQEYEGLL